VLALTTELLGTSVALTDLPAIKSLRGFGMSDPPALARPLEQVFDYTNTFYHQEPRFDVVSMDERHLGVYDFILSSEVLEHVPPPVESAFRTLYRLLKPDGVLVMTVPYKPEGATEEHFPQLGRFAVASLGEQAVLVNRTAAGALELFENLVFHGGGGSTLEMRVFSELDLRRMLAEAGFTEVKIVAADDPAHGVLHNETWSLPVVARKAPFALRRASAAELVHGQLRQRRQNEGLLRELAQLQEACRQKEAELNRELAARTDWAQKLERDFEERTRWALALEGEVRELKALAEKLQRELRERSEWAVDLDRQREELRERLESLERRRWTQLGRKLRLLS
jgi:SAM-dependent methyltransferase